MLQVQGTPNPNAVKVLLPKAPVQGSLVVTKPADAKGNQLAVELLAIPGVKDLFFLQTFVTVSKRPEVAWDEILPKVETVVRSHLG